MILNGNELDLRTDTQQRHAELAEKQRRIERLLSEHNLDAVVISRNENVAWATAGLVDMRVGVQRETGAGSLLVTREGGRYYLTTENEAERFATEEFEQLEYEPLLQPWYANDVEGSIRKAAGQGRIAGDVPFGATPAISLQPYRLELTDAEAERYRWLGRNVAEVTTDVLLALRPGMRETEMQAMLAEQLIRRGILPSVYLCAADDRILRYRHAVPRNAELQRFGMVGLCARRWGLSVSITRFVHFGEVPSDLRDRFQSMCQVYASLLFATREGASSDQLFRVAGQAYAEEGYAGAEKLHHQGGATGYNEREWVARPGGSEQVLRQQAFAWNPNLQGAKVEDTVLYRDGVLEVLTSTARLPVCEATAQGNTYRPAGVLVR
jgi:Xaa-Pro dipeptidase